MRIAVWLILGIALGALLIWYARSRGKGERAVLAIGLILAAAIYVGFALIWGNAYWFFIELVGVPLYGGFVWLSVRHTSIWLALGWLAHPIWDALLHIVGPGHFVAPQWYVVACISFDIFVAGYIFSRYRHWSAPDIEP